jgi:hypothetical protein
MHEQKYYLGVSAGVAVTQSESSESGEAIIQCLQIVVPLCETHSNNLVQYHHHGIAIQKYAFNLN